ncbi:MAG: cupin domain-containing protein [Rhodospirillaceae bacterium]|nr:MAG: cupin domain-containing protein [Rhodospirillaceae bacterium]
MGEGEAPRFAIFRAKDAVPGAEMTVMEYAAVSPVVTEGARRVREAGAGEGSDLKLLFSMPGFSLTYVWFKSGYPLPRHSHNVDCLYYIVGGSLKIGQEELRVGDGFFVGGEVPYTYNPGPAGVEVLEFRAANAFDIKVLANNPAYWDKAVATVQSHRDGWAAEPRPSPVMQSV